MKILHIQRRQPPDKFSMEGYFGRVRTCLEGTADVSVFRLPHFSRGFWRRAINIIAAARKQTDINHVTGDIHYVALLMRRRRTILTVHDCEILERLTGWRRTLVKWLWYILPARRVTAITVNSEETKRQLLKVIKFPAEDIHVVPVSVSELFQPAPKPFNDQCPRILQVGTKANKNLTRLIEALDGICCQLDIIGPLDNIQKQALKRHNIDFNHYIDLTDEEIVERYREADIVSFVSTHEGFGMPIVEAQSIERVCITSNCSSMPEVAGQGACLVDPFDVSAIRAGLNRVITKPEYRKSLIEHGRQNKKRFNAGKIARDFMAIYLALHGEALSTQ